MTHKPSKNHPWRRAVSSQVHAWAKHESRIRDTDYVNSPNTKGIQRKDNGQV